MTSLVAAGSRWVWTTSVMSAVKWSPSGPGGPVGMARPLILASPGHWASLPSMGSVVGPWRAKRGSRRRSAPLREWGMQPKVSWPSVMVVSMPEMRGEPSARRVAMVLCLAWSRRVRMRRAKSGAACSNWCHVVMGAVSHRGGVLLCWVIGVCGFVSACTGCVGVLGPSRLLGVVRKTPVRIVLVCSAFDGLVQRVWLALRRQGHEVGVVPSGRRVPEAKPDLVVCVSPVVVPHVDGVPVVVVHAGPPGDRGEAPLERAIVAGERVWGVSALGARESGGVVVWGQRVVELPEEPVRMSALYAGVVAEAAADVVVEVAAKAADPGFVPPVAASEGVASPPAPGRELSWEEPTRVVVRRVRAADGWPGCVAELCGLRVRVFDVFPGPGGPEGAAGTVAGRQEGAVLVNTGDGTVWVGQLRADEPGAVRLPAAMVLGDRLEGAEERRGYGEVTYDRGGDVGVVGFDFYEGAMSAGQCRRLVAALRYAAEQDTRVVVVRGGEVFARGLHLGVIEASAEPELEAWMNVMALTQVCREVLGCADQLVVSSVGGDAEAGGVMVALAGDRVIVRSGVVLSPGQRSLGLYGGGLWSYLLPRRVGGSMARRLVRSAWPVGAEEAVELGLADRVVPGGREEFERSVLEYAERLAASPGYGGLLAAKRAAREADEARKPLEAYVSEELLEAGRDVFADRRGFRRARRAVVRGLSGASNPA